MAIINVGSSKRDITPDWPVSLAGFPYRKGLSERVAQPLHVRVAVFESEGEAGTARAVVVSADVLKWGPETVSNVRDEIAAVAGTQPDHVLLAATHTHSGPNTASSASGSGRMADVRFLDLLQERTLEAVKAAIHDLGPVTAQRRTASFPLGMYRRVVVDGKMRLGLNPDGPVDNTVTVMSFHRADGTPKTMLTHYTCHPVISDLQEVSGEYPGVAMSEVEQRAGVVSLFLQGCCGDIDPDFSGTALQRRGGDADIVRTGKALANVVLEHLGQPGHELRPVEIEANETSVDLPFQRVPDQQELIAGRDEPGIRGEFCRLWLDHPERVRSAEILTLQRLDLADGLSLLAMNGEVVVAYGLRIRERSGGTVLPMGYSHKMIGYVPTAQQIAEGGYEAEDSALRSLKTSGFAPVIEERINEVIDRLVLTRSSTSV